MSPIHIHTRVILIARIFTIAHIYTSLKKKPFVNFLYRILRVSYSLSGAYPPDTTLSPTDRCLSFVFENISQSAENKTFFSIKEKCSQRLFLRVHYSETSNPTTVYLTKY